MFRGIRINILVVFLFVPALFINAQDRITDDKVFVGYGTGRNMRSADNNAIQGLIDQMAEYYSPSYWCAMDYMLEEPADDKSVAKAIINTYLTYIQNNSDRAILNQSSNYQIERTISLSSFEQIIDTRRFKMDDMLKSAINAERTGKIDDALRYYNWGYYLLLSLPNSDKVSLNGENLMDLIPLRIDEILDGIHFSRKSSGSNELILDISYLDKPVTGLDYIYFNGTDWSNIFSARDGVGILVFDSNIPDDIQVKCECNYLVEAHIDKDINALIDVVTGPSFQGDLKTVGEDKPVIADLNNRQSKADTSDNDAFEKESSELGTLTLLSDEESIPFKDRIMKMISAIESGDYHSVDNLFSLDGLDVYEKLISYSKARIVGSLDSLWFMPSNDEVICRSVPMSFYFENNNRYFVENVCFVFNSDTLIDGISFGLDEAAAKDILYQNSWDEYARKILIEFLENYKTAYALKRLDYLKQVFDDDAYIIVGKVTERPPLTADSDVKYINNKYVQEYRRSKAEYLEELERCFKSNEFINIRFADNTIEKAGRGGEVYGIHIKQDYYSTNYGDTGYLFLMVDLNDPKQPIIKVRVWMPERDPDFFGLSNF